MASRLSLDGVRSSIGSFSGSADASRAVFWGGVFGKMLTLDGAGEAAHQGYLAPVCAGYRYVINAGPPAARLFLRRRGQPFAQLAGREKGDLVFLRDSKLVVAVAGKGKGAVGEREDKAAMTDPVPVQVVRADLHRQNRVARRDPVDPHAELLAGGILGPHHRGRALGTLLRRHIAPP